MTWRYRNTVLVIAVAANFTQMSSRLVISPLVPDVIDTFRTSKTVIGIALTGMWAAYALAQFPSGLLGARFGERRVILASFLLVAAGSFCLALSPSLLFFSGAVFFLGAGAGLYFAVGARLLSKLFDKRGQAIGFVTAAGSFAGLVAPAVSGVLAARYGWRPAALFGVTLAVPILLAVWLLIEPTEPERPEDSLRSRVDGRMICRLLTTPAVAYSIFLAGAGTFAFQSVTSFLPTYLTDVYDVSTAYAGVLFGLVFLMSALAQPLTGRLSDELGRDTVIAGTMLTAIAGFGVILGGPSQVGVVGGVLVLGAGLSWFPVVVSRLMDVLPDEDQSRGFGLTRTAYMLLGALGSVVTGAVADASGWVLAYGVVAGLLAVAVVLVGLNYLSGSRL